jgi:hypothetical protein
MQKISSTHSVSFVLPDAILVGLILFCSEEDRDAFSFVVVTYTA